MLAALGAGSLVYRNRRDGDERIEMGDFKPRRNDASLAAFLRLSKAVTLFDGLDEETAQRMHAVILDEPWGAQHIAAAHYKIFTWLREKPEQRGRALKFESLKFKEGERWFIDHLLTTWFLGIYYHAERPTQRITYRHALMFRSVEDVIPIPYLQATGFDNWGDPPDKLR